MNAGVITPASSSRVHCSPFPTLPAFPPSLGVMEPYTEKLREAAPEMLALILRISESTADLPTLYKTADDATAFIDRLLKGETQ